MNDLFRKKKIKNIFEFYFILNLKSKNLIYSSCSKKKIRILHAKKHIEKINNFVILLFF